MRTDIIRIKTLDTKQEIEYCNGEAKRLNGSDEPIHILEVAIKVNDLNSSGQIDYCTGFNTIVHIERETALKAGLIVSKDKRYIRPETTENIEDLFSRILDLMEVKRED
jgi:hypothetical protein